jgi:hypothetical protein
VADFKYKLYHNRTGHAPWGVPVLQTYVITRAIDMLAFYALRDGLYVNFVTTT